MWVSGPNCPLQAPIATGGPFPQATALPLPTLSLPLSPTPPVSFCNASGGGRPRLGPDPHLNKLKTTPTPNKNGSHGIPFALPIELLQSGPRKVTKLKICEKRAFLPGHRPGVPGTPGRPGGFQKLDWMFFSYVPFLLPKERTEFTKCSHPLQNSKSLLLFSNYLGDYSYSFKGSVEFISITVTVSLFLLQNAVTENNSPKELFGYF